MTHVIVMRRDLTDDERRALEQLHPGEQIQTHRTTPRSSNEHLENCRTFDARIVFLPHEEPIPVPAMRAGVKHLLLKDGQLLELVRVVPEFQPYVPATA